MRLEAKAHYPWKKGRRCTYLLRGWQPEPQAHLTTRTDVSTVWRLWLRDGNSIGLTQSILLTRNDEMVVLMLMPGSCPCADQGVAWHLPGSGVFLLCVIVHKALDCLHGRHEDLVPESTTCSTRPPGSHMEPSLSVPHSLSSPLLSSSWWSA